MIATLDPWILTLCPETQVAYQSYQTLVLWLVLLNIHFNFHPSNHLFSQTFLQVFTSIYPYKVPLCHPSPEHSFSAISPDAISKTLNKVLWFLNLN